MSTTTIDNGTISATITRAGAELLSLRDARGREFLWQGGPEWKNTAPVLFPAIGRVPDDELVHDGVAHAMRQHGFARDLEFTVVETSQDAVTMRLSTSPESLAHYPFRFQLDVRYSLEGARLTIEHTVSNLGDETLAAAVGAHPGFQWPLPSARSKAGHTVQFEVAEEPRLRRPVGGRIGRAILPSPVVDGVLAIEESLFVADALIFDDLRSRSVRFAAPGATPVTVRFADFPRLGLWMSGSGTFLCIEPWSGLPTPEGFVGEFMEQPDIMHIAAGESRALGYSIQLGD